MNSLQTSARKCRDLRRCKADLLEVYAGAGHISEVALKKGLRVIEPIDQVYGITLPRKGKQALVDLIDKRRPFLTIYEIECRLWSPLTNLNYYYRPDVLEELRQGERDGVRSMTRRCEQIHAEGRIFLIENPGPSALWGEAEIERLMNLPAVEGMLSWTCAASIYVVEMVDCYASQRHGLATAQKFWNCWRDVVMASPNMRNALGQTPSWLKSTPMSSPTPLSKDSERLCVHMGVSDACW